LRFATHDSHSSRRTITCTLKQPTRWQREPRQYQPIWSCCEFWYC